MAGSNLTGFNYIPENSEATPGLWNSVFSVLSQNIAEANSSTISSNISTLGMVTINASSQVTDYLQFHDSSNQKSDYLIGSFTTGTADGLNIYDVSGQTMLASFSKQSIRFFQNVVGPVFDTGGALASTYNTATFGTAANSLESRIQAAINQASLDGVARVYVPASMYPYSASSISFINTIQMVREGGDWSGYDGFAYGIKANGVHDDGLAITAAIAAASAAGGGAVNLPGKVMSTAADIAMASNVVVQGIGFNSIIRHIAGVNVIRITSAASNWALLNLQCDGNKSVVTQTGDVISMSGTQFGTIQGVKAVNAVRNCINIDDSTDILITDCVVTGSGNHGILATRTNSGCTNVFIRNSTVSNCIKQGIFVNSQGRFLEITNNVVSYVENGIRLGTDSINSISDVLLTGNRISNCSIDGIRLLGRKVICGYNSSSSNSNTGIKTGGGSVADDAAFQQSLIIGNIISDNSNQGIYVTERGMDDLVIANNSVTSNAGSGIIYGVVNVALGTTQNGKIIGNICRLNRFAGLAMQSGGTYQHFTIAGNTFVDNGRSTSASSDGMSLTSVMMSTIANNVCYDDQGSMTQNYGLRAASCSSLIVVGNVLMNSEHVTSGMTLPGTTHEVGFNQQ